MRVKVHSHGILHFGLHRQVDDTLHTMALGVEQRYTATVIDTALKSNVFEEPDANKEEMYNLGIIHMRKRIRDYHTKMTRANPQYKLSRIDKLTVGMLGDLEKHKPCLKAKGGETSDLTCFCVDLAKEFRHTSENMKMLHRSGEALLALKTTFETNHRRIDSQTFTKSFDDVKRMIIYYKLAGGHLVPKFHRVLHLVGRMLYHGNPKYYGTWQDESENGMVKNQAVMTHALRFVEGVFERQMVREAIDSRMYKSKL